MLITTSKPPNCRTAALSPAIIVSRAVRSIAAVMTISADEAFTASALVSSAPAVFMSAIDDVTAALGDLNCHFAADAAAAADDNHDLAAELLFRRHALQLGFLERPVLDPERLRPRQGDVVVEALEVLRLLGTTDLRQCPSRTALIVQRIRAGHHVDGVDEELGRDPRLALVLAEPEQPEARDDDDRRVRVAQCGRALSAHAL